MGWSGSPAPARQPAAPVAVPAEEKPVAPPPAARPETEAKTAGSALPRLPQFVLENAELALDLRPELGMIDAITLKKYLKADFKEPVRIPLESTAADASGLPGALEIVFPAAGVKAIGIGEDRGDAGHYRLVRRMLIPAAGEVLLEQTWTMSDAYRTAYTVKFSNPGREPLTVPSFIVNTGGFGQWAMYSGDHMRTDPVRFDYCTADGRVVDLNADAKDAKFYHRDATSVKWAAVSNKYFISALLGEKEFKLFQSRQLIAGKSGNVIANAGAEYAAFTLPPGGEAAFNFSYYSGPKVTAQLEAFAPMANRAMHLAWGPLDYLARFMLWALVQLKHFCGSYGWGIVLLTVIVRLLFWPVTARANASMKKMSAIQPKLQELRAKYKDNPQMLNSKTMELYRAEKINPLGGCLPMLMQLPVLFALYATLDSAVELRQVPFLWANDLAAADTVATILGLPINPLVIAWSILMFVQQKITPSAMDPMQQKMMLIMPVVMLFFVYSLPSGLTLYFTVGQIFSLFQMLLQQKFSPNATAAGSGVNPKKA